MPAIFTIVPVFNEDPEVLVQTVRGLLPVAGQVVVVDDGSTQDLREALRTYPVFYLRHSINLGQGAALQTGTTFALQQGADFVVHFDADGQHQPADVAILLEEVAQGGTDVALGSRFLRKADARKIPLLRQVLLQAARFVNFLFTGLWLTDAHQGLRVLNRKAASLITLSENRQAHATELLAQVRRRKLRYREFPVTVEYTAYSRSKGQSSGQSLGILVDLVLNKIFR